ncbi:MAG: hypothetical protein PHQ32_07645 [Firmicutes bacterium]|nr:hypothetical protein [Bacillota bacterium]
MKRTKHLGMILLGIWLLLKGLLELISIPIPFLNIIMAFLAIGAGTLILLDR